MPLDHTPDYRNLGIVNLVASLTAGLGGEPLHNQCTALPGADVAKYRNVVLLVVDGLGWQFLHRQATNPIADAVVARLSSVFPSTTASAITTYMTGLTPAQHGLTGWFTYLRELGSVATVLPFRPRHGGPPYSAMGTDPATVFTWPSMFAQIGARSTIVMPHYIADSDYSRITGGGASRMPYRGLNGYFDAIRSALQAQAGRHFVYAYWPELDSLCHRHGTGSPIVAEHFRALCGGVTELLSSGNGHETLVLLCADHGHIDTDHSHTVELADHPDLTRCLALPLCGEPRAAFCYVHSDAADAFERYVHTRLADQCQLLNRSQLLASGLLGPGTPHREIAHRVGDYLLLMRDNWIIRDRLNGEDELMQIGVHGGLSEQELFVPLARWAM